MYMKFLVSFFIFIVDSLEGSLFHLRVLDSQQVFEALHFLAQFCFIPFLITIMQMQLSYSTIITVTLTCYLLLAFTTLFMKNSTTLVAFKLQVSYSYSWQHLIKRRYCFLVVRVLIAIISTM